ncbi:MAG TPA: hypothetical protein VGD43_11845 [Micromonospora sp.]
MPVVSESLATARLFAWGIARSLRLLAGVDLGETTVSAEDDQEVRHRVFCDALLPGRGRCGLRAEHRSDCVPDPD